MTTRLKYLLATLCLSLLAVVQAQESADSPPAVVSVFVFSELLPSAGVPVELDGRPAGETNRNGALFLELEPREHELRVLPAGRDPITVPLSLVPAEDAQILIRLYRGQPPLIAIESSNEATESGQALAAGAGEGEALTPGDPGQLQGFVFSAESGEAVSGARVFISGTPLDLRTDAEGRFSVNLPQGSYSLSIMHADHATLTRDGIEIAAGEDTPLQIELVPAGLELPEFVVLEPYVEGSLASVLEEQRTSSGVTNVLGAEQISRAGDSDAAGALKRVTGLTLVNGQFIYVRGLGERYSTTSLNGATVPSPDPTRRVVPLDLFPAGIIGSVIVSKSYSAEIPAGFGGGAVGIRTRSIPESPFIDFSVGLGWNSQTTFENGLSYLGGGDDWTGYDDGTRELPADLQEALDSGRPLQLANPFAPEGFTQEELDAFGLSLPNIYSTFDKDIGPNREGSVTGGYRWDLDDGLVLGFLAALDYGDSWANRQEVQRTFRLSNVTESGLEVVNDFEVDFTERDISLSGFFTAGAELGENHRANFTTSYLRLTEDEVQVREGFLRDQGGDVRFTSFLWEERELLSTQLFGESTFERFADLRVNWFYDRSDSSRVAPDQRIYRQDFSEDRDQFGLSLRPDALSRIYDELEDSSDNLGIDLQLPWQATDWLEFIFEAGINEFERDRESQIYRLSFRDRGRDVSIDTLFLPTLEEIFAPELISADGWVIENRTLATDNYTANEVIEARYLAANLTLFNEFKVYLGARDEQGVIEAVTFDPFAAQLEPIVAELVTDDLYPAGTFTWEYNDTSQVRLAYARTVSRPDLRELSPAPFRDPILDLIVIGNPDLIATDIEHLDLRWEKYFSPSESLSVALFRKEFENPIERIIQSGAARTGTFANALAATNQGIEFDFYKGLGFLWDRLEGFYAAGNVAYIESEIELDPFTSGNLTSQTRPLQGQSDIVGNLQLGYDNEELGIKATLLYNYTGERISDVGTNGIPDLVEQPFQQLDAVYSQTFGENDNWALKLKLRNLLDDEVEFLQGPETARAYKRGREGSISIEFRF